MNLVGIIAAACLLYALVWWAGRRDFRLWRDGEDGPSSSMGGVVGELTELFQLSRRIEHEERQRAREARHEDETGAPPLSLDLTAGTAVVRRKRRSP